MIGSHPVGIHLAKASTGSHLVGIHLVGIHLLGMSLAGAFNERASYASGLYPGNRLSRCSRPMPGRPRGYSSRTPQAPIPLVGIHLLFLVGAFNERASYAPGFEPGDRLRRCSRPMPGAGRPRDYSSRTPQRTGSHSSGGHPSFVSVGRAPSGARSLTSARCLKRALSYRIQRAVRAVL